MVSKQVVKDFLPDFVSAGMEMSVLSNMLCPPEPLCKRYIGNATYCALIDLVVGIDLLKGRTEFGNCELASEDDDFMNYMVTVCRRFYTHIVACVEMSCVDICATRGAPIDPDIELFMSYIEALLKASQMRNEDKKAWRVYFDALRILRNKTSHSNPFFKPHEPDVLRNAGLAINIGAGNQMQTSVTNFKPVVDKILTFLDVV